MMLTKASSSEIRSSAEKNRILLLDLPQPPKVSERNSDGRQYRDRAHIKRFKDDVCTKRKNKKSTNFFPINFHRIITQVEKDGLETIISWTPNGRAFTIHDEQAFISNILFKSFNGLKFASFQRQLARYGFSRISKSKNSGSYCHELFLRGKPHLCEYMVSLMKSDSTMMKTMSKSKPDLSSPPPFPANTNIGDITQSLTDREPSKKYTSSSDPNMAFKKSKSYSSGHENDKSVFDSREKKGFHSDKVIRTENADSNIRKDRDGTHIINKTQQTKTNSEKEHYSSISKLISVSTRNKQCSSNNMCNIGRSLLDLSSIFDTENEIENDDLDFRNILEKIKEEKFMLS